MKHPRFATRTIWLATAVAASMACACSHGAGSASGEVLEEAPSAIAPPTPVPGADPEAAALSGMVGGTVGGAAGGAKEGAACGRPGERDCPLQAWMKANMAHQAMQSDLGAMEHGFATLSITPISGYSDWISIARAGAAAAHEGDLDAAKRACKQCHEAYRDRYRAERRSAPFR